VLNIQIYAILVLNKSIPYIDIHIQYNIKHCWRLAVDAGKGTHIDIYVDIDI